jgi:hypothetical protein
MLVILFLIGVVVAFTVIGFNKTADGFDYSMTLAMSILFALMVAYVCQNVNGVETKRVDKYVEIASLERENTLSGKFFLGTGQINSSISYYYFYKYDDARWQLGSDYASNSSIIETDEKSPRVEWQTISYKCPWWVNVFEFPHPVDKDTMVDIIVPKNTIIREFHPN